MLIGTDRNMQEIDKGDKCGTLLTDSSKAFDCLHDLVTAKLQMGSTHIH